MQRDTAFSLLGLPAKFSLTNSEIEEAWRARIALVHPDRFAAAGEAGKRVAEQWAGRLNDAKVELLNPILRAKELLRERGVDLAEESDTQMPQSFLLQQFEWRQRAEDGEKAGVLSDLAAERDRLIAQVAEALDVTGDCLQAREAVRELLFVEKLGRDLES